MRALLVAVSVAALAGAGGRPMHAAAQYPLALTLDAKVTTGVTTITSKLTVRVDRAMGEISRTQVANTLNTGGYATFLNALRPLPLLGTLETQAAKVDIKYTREDPEGAGSRLVLVADRPLFFLSPDPDRAKSPFQLTVVELHLDGKGGVTGQMTGAARVRPGPDGSVLLDDYADQLVQLTGQAGK